ncbi:MAG: hypothetical protein UZ06_CHB003000971, partial [Chlorobi bacterium OLB6]
RDVAPIGFRYFFYVGFRGGRMPIRPYGFAAGDHAGLSIRVRIVFMMFLTQSIQL